MTPEYVWIARDDDFSLGMFFDEPDYITKDWKPNYWDSDGDKIELDPETFDEVEVGEKVLFEFRRVG